MSCSSLVRSRGLSRLFALSTLTLLSAGGCVAETGIAADEQAIYGGTIDNGDPSVYMLYRDDGYSCTASVISPHVVLTARHCVVNTSTDAPASPGIFHLYVGRDPSSFTREYRVSAVRIIPGSTGNIQTGLAEDLALLILTSAASETPYTVSRESPSALNGQTFTAVGFGQTPTNPRAAVKYRTTGTVTGVMGGLILVNPTICEGDSGGPFIGADGSVWGVVSFGYTEDGTMPGCGSLGAYNALYFHLDWLDSVLEEAGDICVARTEVCDGLDNDCNGVADEGCLLVGDACTDSSRCTSGFCEPTGAGMICTTQCDPTRPAFGCEDGYHCVDGGSCSGFCVPGAMGTLGIDADCTDDASCASGACVDPGDGRRRCLAPCFGDAGQCASGEVCTAADGGCGACVPSRLFGSPHGLGEECTDDASCRSGHCGVRDGVSECIEACNGTSCRDGFTCISGACVLDRNQPTGGLCDDAADCAAGQCAHAGSRSWCTPTDCSGAPCPNGTACQDLGGGVMVCAPTLQLPGERCSTDAQCGSSSCFAGQCVTECTEANDCGPGTRCVRTADGTGGRCMRPSATPSNCGCSAAGAGGARGAGWLALGLALALVVRRRVGRGER